MRFAPSVHSASSRRSIGTIRCGVFFAVVLIPFYSCGLRAQEGAQEGSVIGDRSELQKVLDAYDQLSASILSWAAKHFR